MKPRPPLLFAALLALASAAALVAPSPARTPAPAGPAPSSFYSVAAGDALHVNSAAVSEGLLQPRYWYLTAPGVRYAGQSGYNAGWVVPWTVPAGDYTLGEYQADGAGPVASHPVRVTASPYAVVKLAPGADLRAAVNARPVHTHFVLAGGDYVVTSPIYIGGQVLIQGAGAGKTRIVCRPVHDPHNPEEWPELYALWLTTGASRLGLYDLTVTSDTAGLLNSAGKTACHACYAAYGSAYAQGVTFGRLDFGWHGGDGADGMLLQDCRWDSHEIYGCGAWLNGRRWVVQGCRGSSRLEHPIRASIVDARNPVPEFLRIAGNDFSATHQHMPGKEAAALRDGRYVYFDSNRCDNWVGLGQGVRNGPWDVFEHFKVQHNTISHDTIHVRAGVSGGGVVSHNQTAAPVVVSTKAPVTVKDNRR